MRIYPILLAIGIILLAVSGYLYYSEQKETTQEIVPCYDFKGNVISGAECIETANYTDARLALGLGIIYLGVGLIGFRFSKLRKEQ